VLSCPVRKVAGASSARFCFHQPEKIAASIPVLGTWKDPLLFKKVTTKRAPPTFWGLPFLGSAVLVI